MEKDESILGSNDEKELRLMHGELCDQSGNLSILDLHGFTKEQAIDELRQFLSHQIFVGESCCRIIHGKGEGVLERAVKKEIENLIKQQKIQTSFPSRPHPTSAIVVVFPKSD